MSDFFQEPDNFGGILEADLLDADLQPFPLSGKNVSFEVYSKRTNCLVLTAPAVVVDYTLSRVSYTWSAGDLPDVGFYQARFIVEALPYERTFFPQPNYLEINGGVPV